MKLNRKIRLFFTVAALVFIGGSLIGTLAIPVALAVNVSAYWLFLYAGYALMILYVVLYFVRYWPNESVTKDRR